MNPAALVEALYEEELKPVKIEEVKGLSPNPNVDIFLKREYPTEISGDPLRILKRKPASFILEDLVGKGYLNSRRAAISASSGNFARELSLKAGRMDIKLIAVVPPRIPEEHVRILTALGADVLRVTEEYDLCPRETTVFFTRALAEHYRFRLVNVDQYNSWQNVLSHLFTTWEEIKEFGEVDYVVVQLGSTGTFMGVSLGKQAEGSKARIVGVQPPKVHHVPGVHHIIDGCEWSPEIYSSMLGDGVATVDDVDAYAALVKLWERGVHAGPSTGMGAAYSMKLAEKLKEGSVLLVSADSAFTYYDYILKFLEGNGNRITARYPELEGLMEKYKAWLKGAPSLKERIDAIKRAYKPEREGAVHEISEVDHEFIAKLLG